MIRTATRLVLVIEMVAANAFAGSVLYNINFSGTSMLPTSGSFIYDATTETFSDFLITWEGQTYDLTAAANDPYIYADPCAGLAGGAASFAALSGNCEAQAGGVAWIAGNQLYDEPFAPASNYFGITTDAPPLPSLAFTVNGTPIAEVETNVSGGLTIIAVPEPSTVLLVLIAAGVFVGRRRLLNSGRG
jgi:hypothetical protein